MTQKRVRQTGRSQGVQLGLIITPMLDMAFQILAFFIMTYNPSALEAHIPGSLVPDNVAVRDRNQPAAPQPEVPMPADALLLDDLKETVTIQVKANAKGQGIEGTPSQLLLKLPLEVAPRLIADIDGNFSAALKHLDAELHELVKTETIGKANIKIAADGELRQRYVIQVYDAVRKCGFSKVHFVPPPVLNEKLK